MNSKTKVSNSLAYSSAAHGDWGIVRVGMLVPESYQLFICPFACGRHGALGAYFHENKDRLSYLYLEESDIVSGSYEDDIVKAVDDLIYKYHKKFKALMLMVSCIDDLMATDHESIIEKLKINHPEIDFHFGHMNPISADGKLPPAINIQKSIYSFIKKSNKKNNSIIITGTNVSIDKNSEIYTLASLNNYTIKHISEAKNYQEYQDLGKAKLNIVFNQLGKESANDLKNRIALDYFEFMTSYDLKQIKRNYQQLNDLLNLEYQLDYDYYISKVKDKIKEVKEILENREIAIDDTSSIVCFALAKFLIGNGFNVKYMLSDGIRKFDEINYQWLNDNTNIEFLSYTASDSIKKRFDKPNIIALGLEAAYYFNSNHSINLMFDGGLFGFEGIILLLDMIKEASLNKTEVKDVIQKAGLVV